MLLVIASGAVGVWAYAVLPPKLSENRGETTRKQMLAAIQALDEQIQEAAQPLRSEEHTSELQSLMRISYAVFCLTTKNTHNAHRLFLNTVTHNQTKHNK